MSKILLVGDIHLGLGYPNRLDHFFEVTSEYFEKFLFPYVKDNLSEDDIIVLLGDLFDNRDVVPINILNYALYVLETLSKTCPVHVIIGNHDLYTRSTSEINSVKPFMYMPNIFVYNKTTKIEFNGKKICMMPFIENKELQVNELKKNSGCDYLFCHSDLNGAKMHLTSVAHRNKHKIDVEEFGGYKNVYSGHIHLVQRNKNFTFIGSIHEMDRNDTGNQKGIFLLDTFGNTELFIPNNISPKFKKIYINSEEDIQKLDEMSVDWVDLFISNSLLINNRKLRRKLESILRENKFESVDYIDDIVSEKKDVEEEIINESQNSVGETISINLDYAEYIKNFIKLQKYEMKVEDGILGEFEGIIDIYNESNKKNLN
jgi:DNA repair exonuclease SbcCD nuclease subunit